MSRFTAAERIQVFAIVRLDGHLGVGEDAVTVKEVLPTLEDAEAEVTRLNELNKDKGAKYFWRATRFFPEGRKGSTRKPEQ